VSALTPPIIVAGLVLCAAGVAKLRSPAPAAFAVSTLGLPPSRLGIRVLAACELVVGALAMVHPGSAAVPVAVLYALFAVVSLELTRRRASCGCFGERDVPASWFGAALSAALALVALAVAIRGAHGIGWVLGHGIGPALTLSLGIVGAGYATVVAYTDLPLAWASWSVR
jgi:hypothetical protein